MPWYIVCLKQALSLNGSTVFLFPFKVQVLTRMTQLQVGNCLITSLLPT